MASKQSKLEHDDSGRNSASSDGPRFREAGSSDQPAIREILREANLSYHSAKESGQSPENSSSSARTAGGTHNYVCERDGKITGVLQWRNIREESEVLGIAVRPEVRGRGNATFIMSEFVNLMREQGIQQIFLEVRESNLGAIALYRKFGFAISGRRANYYQNPDESALLLSLKIQKQYQIPSLPY